MPRPRVVALLIAVFLLLAACGDADDPAAPPIDDADGSNGAPADGSSENREVSIAIADAADRAGVPAEDVSFESFEEVTWPDGALGCPQPDEMYTQALVEGYRIVLEVDGERWHYHGAIGDDPFHCEDPEEPVDG